MTVTAAGKRRIASLKDERRSSVAESKDIASLLSRKIRFLVGLFQLQYLQMQVFVKQKFQTRKFACSAAGISLGLQMQLLRLAGAQGLVQTFEFIPVFAEPGRRPDGRAVLAAQRALYRSAS